MRTHQLGTTTEYVLCHSALMYGVLAFGVLISHVSVVFAQSEVLEGSSPWAGYSPDRDNVDWIDAEIGVLSLYRTQLNSTNFVFDNTAQPLLNMDQIHTGAGRGIDAMLNFRRFLGTATPADLQFRFFESRGMLNDTVVTNSTPVFPVFFSGIPAQPANSYLIDYETDLLSFESNFAMPVFGSFKALVGLRYFEVDERFDILNIAASSPSVNQGFFSAIDNSMIGGQIGIEGNLLTGTRGRITASTKWAVVNNFVEGFGQAVNPANGTPLITDMRENHAAQLIDLQLGGVLSVTDWLSIYTGYQGLLGYGMALAPTQSVNNSVFQPTSPVHYEAAQWHGFRLGASLNW